MAIVFSRFGHGSAELENSLYVVGGHTAIAGVFPASPSVSLKQVKKALTSLFTIFISVCKTLLKPYYVYVYTSTKSVECDCESSDAD